MHHLNNLPDVLLPYKANILATVKPTINITLKPAKDLPLWASKVGGKPYLPKNFKYPTDNKGNPLSLLAQFNMADLPNNDSLPKTGMLSFFISGFDGVMGLSEGGFWVAYFHEVLTNERDLWQDFNQIHQKMTQELWLPFNPPDEFALTFELSHKEISYHDRQIHLLFGGQSLYDVLDDKAWDWVKRNAYFNGGGHHLLGYPAFCQEDPRYHSNMSDYVLLFQLDSDDKHNILWGDVGVGNFFIHPDNLAKLDFSKVMYYWDCF